MAEGDGRTASFHLSALYSPFLTWAEVAIEHGAARNDPPRMQAWQNLMLGEPYEDVAAQPIAVGWLAARAESYENAPQGVAVVTAGIDVKDDRLEVELVGFGTSMPPWPRWGKNRVTPLYLIGVDSLKGAFMARLRIEEPGAGFCHFPVGRGLDYYAGLTS